MAMQAEAIREKRAPAPTPSLDDSALQVPSAFGDSHAGAARPRREIVIGVSL
jgi:hypothetical protein